MEKANRSVNDNMVSKFKTLGLTTYAARAFLALVSLPSASAGDLCKLTGIPDSKIYYVLSELEKRGMIAVQEGTPNLYRALHPKEAQSNLKQQLSEEFNRKASIADSLAESLTPIYEGVEGGEEIELAYVIRGRRSIIRKMRDLIGSARDEVLVYVSDKELLQGLSSSIRKAIGRVDTKFAVSKELWQAEDFDGFGEVRILACPSNLVISDMRMLITVSSWKDEVAVMTTDRALMTMSREYYENPKCCEKTC